MTQRSAGAQKFEIFLFEAFGLLFVDGVERIHETIPEGISIDIERNMDEMRYIGPINTIVVSELEGGTKASALHIEPDRSELFGGELALFAPIVDDRFELTEGDLTNDGVDLILDLRGQEHPPARRIAFLREQRLEGELFAEDRGGFGER